MKRFLILTVLLTLAVPLTAMAEYISVKVPVANIRSGPSDKSDLLWKVETYHPLFILEKKDSWYHFRDFEGDEGWINSGLVNKERSVITKKDDCNVHHLQSL